MVATASPTEIARFTLKCGDVIITKDSESWNDIAVPAYVTDNMPGVLCGYHLAHIRPDPSIINGRFLSRAFVADGIKQQFQVAANGITRFGLPNRAIDNAIFPIPPIDEQAEIAKFLDCETARIDELTAKKRRLINLLQIKRKALISQAVTKGLDPNAPMKPSDIAWLSEVPAHWSIYRIANLFRDVAESGNQELPILSVSIHRGVSDEQIADEDMERKVIRSEDLTKYIRVIPGDLVYNMMRAWQGAFGAVKVEGMVSPAYVIARPRIDLETSFIENLLRTSNAVEEMRRNSHGVTDFRLRLYWDKFKNIRIALPPKKEAIAICRHIDKVNEATNQLIEINEKAISTLQKLRSALITAAVTGQIDVRNYRLEAPCP